MPIPLTGAQYQISAGDYTAAVTELGAGLRALHHRGTPLLAGYHSDQLPPGGAGQLLAPWPNRVNGGRYSFGGAQLQLDLSEPAAGNAIHGLTRWATWVPVAHDPDRVVLYQALRGHPGYPFCLDIEAGYQLDAKAGLRVDIIARNSGQRPRSVRNGLASVPDRGNASHRRLRADRAGGALAADRGPRHSRGAGAGRRRHPV